MHPSDLSADATPLTSPSSGLLSYSLTTLPPLRHITPLCCGAVLIGGVTWSMCLLHRTERTWQAEAKSVFAAQ